MKQVFEVGGTTQNNDEFTGPARMFTIDTDRWEIRLHDNETAGGHRILNLQQLLQIFMQLDSEFGGVAFAPDARGFLVRIGDKQYGLRTLTAGTGITITNGDGVAADPQIKISDDFSIISAIAGRLAFGGDTTGTGSALALTLPTGWPDVDGGVGIFNFHVNPEDGATLTINGATALPLVCPNGDDNISRVAKLGTRVMFMRASSKYYLVGMQHPDAIGIETISGMTATTVQDALAELTSRIAALEGTEGPVGVQFFTFTENGQAASLNDGILQMPLADGEYRFVQGVATANIVHTGGSSGSDVARIAALQINGVGIPSHLSLTVSGNPVGYGYTANGIVYRDGTAIWFAPSPANFNLTSGAQAMFGSRMRVGSVAADATILQFQSPNSNGGNVAWTYSAAGTAVTS